MRIRRIHQVTLAVRDLDGARQTFSQLFGLERGGGAEVPEFGVRTVDLALGESVLRLASPVQANNPVMSFLQRKGEGFYNIALEVDDLDAAVDELAQAGVRVSEPVEAEPGVRSAFVTMAATHGLSVQLVEVLRDEDEEPPTTMRTTIEEPRAEHLPPSESGDAPPEPATPAAPRQPLDLTPDEWSDTD